jgi:hypothetical protein
VLITIASFAAVQVLRLARELALEEDLLDDFLRVHLQTDGHFASLPFQYKKKFLRVLIFFIFCGDPKDKDIGMK